MILAGDIGGTKTYLALYSPELSLLASAIYPSQNYPGLFPILQQFLSEQVVLSSKITAVCLGIAGTICAENCTLPNLPRWSSISLTALKQFFKLEQVKLLNDLEAMGWGISRIKAGQIRVLQMGKAPENGNAVLLAAGTGLGESCLYWDGSQHLPIATEGGHSDFAPRNTLEIGLLQYLTRYYSRVSYERVLSGTGLVHIYQYLCELHQHTPLMGVQTALQQGADPSALITELGLAKTDYLCQESLRVFVSIYGAEAGNFALKFMGRAGVYLGGGIAPKILPQMMDGTFIQAFNDKGRFADLMQTIPVSVILIPEIGLWGAAHYARLAFSDSSREQLS